MNLGDAAPTRSVPYRLSIFAYGVLAYCVGVGALVAAMLILLGIYRFSGGPLQSSSFAQALALDLSLLVLFAVQHSAMARPSFKARWTRIIPVAAERSSYVLATGLVLIPMLLLWQPMPTLIWSIETPAVRWLLLAIAVAGWGYLLAASFAINHFELFGLQQVYQALRGQAQTPAPFRERWMYRFDRHPIMTGILIGLWVSPTMTLDHLLFALGCTIYVWIGVFFEERSLRRQLGEPYEDYCRRVPSIVPTFGAHRTKSETSATAISPRSSR